MNPFGGFLFLSGCVSNPFALELNSITNSLKLKTKSLPQDFKSFFHKKGKQNNERELKTPPLLKTAKQRFSSLYNIIGTI